MSVDNDNRRGTTHVVFGVSAGADSMLSPAGNSLEKILKGALTLKECQ